MDTLHEQLDRAIGDGPPLTPIDNHVRAGRRALRRRRAATGVAGLAATAVLATGWYAISPSTPSDSDRLAVDPLSSNTPSASQSATAPAQAPWAERELIRYVDGELQVRPKVVVHEHIKNPYSYASPGLSDALDVTWKGKRQWLLINRDPVSGGASSATTPDNGWASFAAYVSDQVSGTGSGWPDTMRITDQGEVVPTAGTQVFDRTDGLDFGPSFAPQGATSGAAIVSPAGEDGRYFVVWRVLDGAFDVLTLGPDEVADQTLDELVAYASVEYISGDGLR
ncbi:hypothetical protein [Nocardioides gilvus]|uniref:hypothetical protein n=1 Tax=Nocardioides gilvus TaxID=1735589 RepID=UPI000D74AA1B|nr:hypothetical protein [Nocardioides gilvus]